VNAGYDLHQGAFSCTVFADDRVNAFFFDSKGDVPQRLNPRKTLRNSGNV
jgi:hypothetical protein